MSDDLIKRADAIETAYQLRHKPNDAEWEDWLKSFNAIPSADRPQGEWIPCSERLPKIGQKVLASTKKTVFTQVFKGYHSDPKTWAWENNSVKRIEVWQPLPKPWKGADDEQVDMHR